jgi:DNA polymerase III epsilon subunit-like protein
MPYRPRSFNNVKAFRLPRSYVCYDLETTGLGRDAHVIEIGAVRVLDGYEDEKFSTFVALPRGRTSSPGPLP